MTKILIISYFFPPSNFVGGERMAAWYRHLQENNIYPILITRCWNQEQNDLIGKIENNVYSVEKSENGEIHRVPVPHDPRYKLKGLIRKLVTLKRLLNRKTNEPVYEFKNIYEKCVDILSENQEIKTVIASGRPFESFQLGYLLKKKFDINWIPDYRDEWNTHQAPTNNSWLWKIVKKREIKFEKVWTSNADHFTTVSKAWKNRISTFINKEGTVIMNGYDSLHPSTEKEERHDKSLHMLYSGTLYASQRIELIITCIKRLQNEGKNIKVTFIGTEMIPDQNNRLLELSKNMSDIAFYNRMPKYELQKYQQQADVLFMTGFENVVGWLPVKLFDYYASSKMILVCPSDHDIIEQFVSDTNSGVCINDLTSLEFQLKKWCEMKEDGQPIKTSRNLKKGKTYSRSYQTKKLANLLNSLQ